jgi:hypothetical protein
MKIYHYEFDVQYGDGHGIVIAQNEEKAKELVRTQDEKYETVSRYEKIEIELKEIDPTKEQIHSFSWIE